MTSAAGRPIPVFTGGTGKSGTTVVAALLGRHPDAYASVPREIRFVTDRAGLLQLCYGLPEGRTSGRRLAFGLQRSLMPGASQRVLLREFAAQLDGAWWQRPGRADTSGLSRAVERADLDVLRDAFVADFPREGEDAARAFLFGVIAHQRGFEGERLWIDTTPLNIANADRIARLLPTARFVHMVRDGRSTAVSITRQRWGPDEPFEALRWWADRMRHAWQGARALPAGSLLTLHLEDLVVRRREETLQSLLDFFELREARRMRTFFDTRMPAERVDLLGWRTAVPDPAAFDVEYHRLVDALVRDGVPRELVADASREA